MNQQDSRLDTCVESSISTPLQTSTSSPLNPSISPSSPIPSAVIRLPNITLPSNGFSFALTDEIPEGSVICGFEYEYKQDDADFRESHKRDGVPVVEIPPIECGWGRIRQTGREFTITPQKTGTHEIRILAKAANGREYQVNRTFRVNPNPRDLWKDLEVAEGTPFKKDNQDRASVWDGMSPFRVIAASQRGRSHAHVGSCRDDDMKFCYEPSARTYFMAVADGAGSARYSRKGSEIAVRAVLEEMKKNITAECWNASSKSFDALCPVCLKLLSSAYHARYAINEFVKSYNAGDGANLGELAVIRDFNTTLLLAAVHVEEDGALRIASFSIGDGAIAWQNAGKSQLLCTPDGGEYSGQTQFLTTASVWNEAIVRNDDQASVSFRKEFLEKRCFTTTVPADEAKVGRFFLMTDGVSDPFFETDNRLKCVEQWDKFILEENDDGISLEKVCGKADDHEAVTDLLKWLSFWSPGNHDDRTISILAAVPRSDQEKENESKVVPADMNVRTDSDGGTFSKIREWVFAPLTERREALCSGRLATDEMEKAKDANGQVSTKEGE